MKLFVVIPIRYRMSKT